MYAATEFSSCLSYEAENNQRFKSRVSNSTSYTNRHKDEDD